MYNRLFPHSFPVNDMKKKTIQTNHEYFGACLLTSFVTPVLPWAYILNKTSIAFSLSPTNNGLNCIASNVSV